LQPVQPRQLRQPGPEHLERDGRHHHHCGRRPHDAVRIAVRLVRRVDAMLRVIAAAVLSLVLFRVAAETPRAQAARLRAGAGKVEITPKASDLTIATDSIRDPLFARAVVIDDGSACAVLVGLDLGGASTALVTDAITRASAATGCAPANFLISATHTHSSNTQGLGQGPPAARTVADAIVEAVK